MDDQLRITFGICTFNRKSILEKSVASLKNIKDIEKANILIVDDCSTEYDESFLRNLFPSARIIRQKHNKGPDKNTSIMYEEFLKSDDDWLLNADSDLIYRSDIMGAIQQYKDKSKGFITFFNCINHNTIGKKKYLVEKDSVGAAGCLLHRTIVKYILDNISFRNNGFDVGFSKLLRDSSIRLYATKDSYVQHIGVSGFNSKDITFDYGENFRCDSLKNAEILEETFETYLKTVNKFKKRKSWKIYYFLTSSGKLVKIYRILSRILFWKKNKRKYIG